MSGLRVANRRCYVLPHPSPRHLLLAPHFQLAVYNRRRLYEEASRDLLPGGVPNTPLRRISYDIKHAINIQELVTAYDRHRRNGPNFKAKHHAAVLMQIPDLLYIKASAGQLDAQAPLVARLLDTAQQALAADGAVARLLEGPKIVKLLFCASALRVAPPRGLADALADELLRDGGKKVPSVQRSSTSPAAAGSDAAQLLIELAVSWASIGSPGRDDLWDELRAVALAAVACQHPFTLQQLADLAAAFAASGHADDRLLGDICEAATSQLAAALCAAGSGSGSGSRRLTHLPPLARLSWALARAGWHDERLMGRMCEAALHVLMAETPSSAAQMAPLVQLVHACGHLLHHDAPLCDAVARLVTSSGGRLLGSPHQHAQVLWALRRLGHPYSEPLFTACCARLLSLSLQQEEGDEEKEEDEARGAPQLPAAGDLRGRAVQSSGAGSRSSGQSALGSLDVGHLSDLLWALGSAQHYEAQVFDLACAAMMAKLTSRQEQAAPAAAAATAGGSMPAAAAAAASAARGLAAAQVVQVLLACGQVGHIPDAAFLRAAVAVVRLGLHELSIAELCDAAEACRALQAASAVEAEHQDKMFQQPPATVSESRRQQPAGAGDAGADTREYPGELDSRTSESRRGRRVPSSGGSAALLNALAADVALLLQH